MKKKKYPDNIVFNEESEEFDAHKKSYPTNLGAPAFAAITDNKVMAHKADSYFSSRLTELKEEYQKLVNEYEWTKLVYEADYSFEPLTDEPYHLYEREDRSLFLSLISPSDWEQPYVGTFKLLTTGKWEKIIWEVA